MAYQQPPGYSPYPPGQGQYQPPPPNPGYQPAPYQYPPPAQQQQTSNVVVVQQQQPRQVSWTFVTGGRGTIIEAMLGIAFNRRLLGITFNRSFGLDIAKPRLSIAYSGKLGWV